MGKASLPSKLPPEQAPSLLFEVYRNPTSSYVAAFIGETNLLEGTVKGSAPGRATVDTKVGPVTGRVTDPQWSPSDGEKVIVSVRPEAIRISDANGQSHGKILETVYLGDVIQYKLQRPSGLTLQVAEMNPHKVRQPGDENIHLSMQPEDVVVVRD